MPKHSVLKVATKLSASALSQGLPLQLMPAVTLHAGRYCWNATAAYWLPRSP